ncbi:MAG: response regulator [Flavobacteriales bacterium]|nr:response regulator [Flavobacteriales bacterium]
MSEKQNDKVKTQSEIVREQYTLDEIQQLIQEFNQKKEPPRGKIKVLYVDDELTALKSFKALFRRDYDIFIANSAEEGRSVLKKHAVEVIITDQRMPEETGSEFLTSILKEYPGPIRILLTGYSDIDAVINAINEGKIYRYMPKPYRSEEMKQVIDNAAEVFDLRKAKEELTQVALRANQQLEFMLRQKLLD